MTMHQSQTSFYPTKLFREDTTHAGRVIIVTRTKNRPVLLARAFSSVLSQTYPNWILCLVNDGGDAKKVENLVDAYRDAFGERLVVKHNPDSMGMEAASNAAFSGIDGDYLVVHDDDDAWHPDFLVETTSFLRKYPEYAAVATNCEVVTEEIEKDRVIEKERLAWSYWKERVDFLHLLHTNNVPPICIVIRKAVVDQIGPYNENLPVLGDWDYNLRIMLVGDIGTISKVLAYYHHRRAITTSSDYGNSVTAGTNLHAEYQTKYRNSLMRKLLAESPGHAGFLHILLVRLQNLEDQLAASDWKRAHEFSHLKWIAENNSHFIASILYKIDRICAPLKALKRLLKT